MPIQKLRRFLDKNSVKYAVITRGSTDTSSAPISGSELAKTVMLEKVDGEFCMVVLPASKQLDLAAFAKFTNSGSIYRATERDFKNRFPGCEVGAMPPFENLHGLHVYADKSLAGDKEIVFNGGSHLDLVKLAFRDFERLVEPTIADLAIPRSANRVA